MSLPPGWPMSWNALIDSKSLVLIEDGRLGNRLYRGCTTDGTEVFIKVASGYARKDLRCEQARLRWISGRLSVPIVIAHDSVAAVDFLALSAISGLPAHQATVHVPIEVISRQLGIALHTVHALPTIGCPFDDVVDKELIAAERRLRSGHIHVESFKAANGGRHPAAVLCSLRSRLADLGEVVFTHGDYALPNVILDGGRWKGLIDWEPQAWRTLIAT